MPDRFHGLFRELSLRIKTDYEEARSHARNANPQRAGHEGEATWQTLIKQWGPGLPVETRKYIVGPGGDSNEVDLVILKPDYPEHLRSHSSVLVSGVAAAFSVKLTLKRAHILEALEQKKLLVSIAGEANGTKEILSGPFPFGLLSHSTEMFSSAAEFTDSMIELYEDIAHSPVGPTVVDPRHELDALLVADKGFFRTIRTSLAPNTDLTAAWSPMTSFNKYSTRSDLPGIHVAHFIAWLGSQFNTKSGYALQSLESIFDGNSMSGFMTRWPTSIYPDHIRNNQSKLINEHGMPLCF